MPVHTPGKFLEFCPEETAHEVCRVLAITHLDLSECVCAPSTTFSVC